MRNDDLIGSAEACELLGGINRGTLVRWIASGKINTVTKMPGARGAYVFTLAEVQRVAAERRAAGALAS